jgi:hypothetical protein
LVGINPSFSSGNTSARQIPIYATDCSICYLNVGLRHRRPNIQPGKWIVRELDRIAGLRGNPCLVALGYGAELARHAIFRTWEDRNIE